MAGECTQSQTDDVNMDMACVERIIDRLVEREQFIYGSFSSNLFITPIGVGYGKNAEDNRSHMNVSRKSINNDKQSPIVNNRNDKRQCPRHFDFHSQRLAQI